MPHGTTCQKLLELGYDLIFPMVAIPLGELRHTCEAWRMDRRVQPLAVATFLCPELHEIWQEHTKFLKELLKVPRIYAFCPPVELWDKPFDQRTWSNADLRTYGRSALWAITTGSVLWAEGAHPVDEMAKIGQPAWEYWFVKKQARSRKKPGRS
jgi:hypothetical protein